jgi:hypothetical protein
LDDVPGALLAQMRDRGLGDIDDTEEIRLDLRAEAREGGILDRSDVAVSGIVDEDVESSEGFECALDGVARCSFVRDVERDGAHLIAIALDEIGKPAKSGLSAKVSFSSALLKTIIPVGA